MNLWRVAIDEGTGEVQGAPEALTTPSPFSAHASISRDGSRIAYVQWLTKSDIERVEFDPVGEAVTGNPVAITRGTKPYSFPVPSPDGAWLVYSSSGKPEDLYIIRTDGTGQRQLTDDAYVDRFPRWSPDGHRIAFMSDRSGGYEIWLINRDGGGLRQLTFTSGTVVAGCVWSPDGTRIAYNQNGANPGIVAMDKAWGEQPRQILAHSDFLRESLWAHSWSSDGKMLAGDEAHRGGIAFYSFESQTFERLTDSGVYPVWLTDNRRLLYIDRGAFHVVDIRSMREHAVSPVIAGLGSRAFLSPDNRSIYFGLSSSESDVWLLNMH